MALIKMTIQLFVTYFSIMGYDRLNAASLGTVIWTLGLKSIMCLIKSFFPLSCCSLSSAYSDWLLWTSTSPLQAHHEVSAWKNNRWIIHYKRLSHQWEKGGTNGSSLIIRRNISSVLNSINKTSDSLLTLLILTFTSNTLKQPSRSLYPQGS